MGQNPRRPSGRRGVLLTSDDQAALVHQQGGSVPQDLQEVSHVNPPNPGFYSQGEENTAAALAAAVLIFECTKARRPAVVCR